MDSQDTWASQLDRALADISAEATVLGIEGGSIDISDDDDDDADMVIHVKFGDEPRNGTEYENIGESLVTGFLPLTLNDTDIEIPWTIRIVKWA